MNPLNVVVGDTVGFAIAYFDQNGNPMVTTPTPDSPPTWSDTNTAVGDLSQSADGTTAQESIVGAGTDSVSVNLTVGGVAFTAELTITASAATTQTLSSIEIVPTVTGPSNSAIATTAVRRFAAKK
jgi:hypothetical protein